MGMEEIKIRLIRHNELREAAKVYAKAFNNSNVGEEWTEESAFRLLNCLIKKQEDLSFIGEIVGGYFATIKPWWDGNHLTDAELFVNPSYQKLGVGKKLCIKMYETALDKYKISIVEASTFKNKAFPLSWHKKVGFQESKDLILIDGNPKEILKNLKDST